MRGTRFTTVADDTEKSLNVETLLTFIFARPVGVVAVWTEARDETAPDEFEPSGAVDFGPNVRALAVDERTAGEFDAEVRQR